MTRAIPAWKPECRTHRFACVRARISSWSFSCRELWRRDWLGSANGTRTPAEAGAWLEGAELESGREMPSEFVVTCESASLYFVQQASVSPFAKSTAII